jgi:hypothetical protein
MRVAMGESLISFLFTNLRIFLMREVDIGIPDPMLFL